MPDTIGVVDYYYTTTPDKVGEGARLLGVLRDSRTNLLALSAFPSTRKASLIGASRVAQIDDSVTALDHLVLSEDELHAIEEALTTAARPTTGIAGGIQH